VQETSKIQGLLDFNPLFKCEILLSNERDFLGWIHFKQTRDDNTLHAILSILSYSLALSCLVCLFSAVTFLTCIASLTRGLKNSEYKDKEQLPWIFFN